MGCNSSSFHVKVPSKIRITKDIKTIQYGPFTLSRNNDKSYSLYVDNSVRSFTLGVQSDLSEGISYRYFPCNLPKHLLIGTNLFISNVKFSS